MANANGILRLNGVNMGSAKGEFMNLDEVLARARKKKLEAEENDRQKRKDELKRELDDLSRKQRSAEIQNTTFCKERLETQKKLGELRALKDYVEESEFSIAETNLLTDLNDLEVKLQDHKALMDALSQKISSLQTSISNVLNTRTLSSGETTEDNYILSAYNNSRDSIKQAYDEVRALKDLLLSCNGSIKLIHCHCRIAAGNLRVLQDEIEPPATAPEQIVLRRSFGIIGSLTKDYHCGIVTALSKDRKDDWRQYVNQARLERDKLLHETQTIPKVRESQKDEEKPKKERIEVPLDVLNRVKDKKLVFFGGDKEVQMLVEFAEQDLQAKRVTWYQSKKNDYESLLTSIAANGPDIVVMLNLWSSHKFSSPIIAACKKANIPFVELLSSSREALRDQLANWKASEVA
jgi:hypothetical protein